jgi:uncharacterized protein RhaS with RHS repeats
MGARVYNPYTGTFTQPDPIQGGGANAYGYTDGDPVNEIDLTGDAACGWAEPWGCAIDAGEDIVDDAGGAALDLGSKVFGGVAGAILGPLIFPSNVGASRSEMTNSVSEDAESSDKSFNPDQQAVVDLAKGAQQRGGLSQADAETLLGWGAEAGLDVHGPETHDHGSLAGVPHIHVGPVNHIPVR